MNCWEIKPDCQFKGQDPQNAMCPAYQSQTSCWQLDWVNVINSLPEDTANMFKNLLPEHCPECAVYPHHQDEIDRFLITIKAM